MARSKQWVKKALFATDFWKARWEEKAVADRWKENHGFISSMSLPLGETLAVIVFEICLLFCQFELIKEYNGITLCSFHLDSEKNTTSYCFTLDWLFPGKEVLLNHAKIVGPVWCFTAISGRIRLTFVVINLKQMRSWHRWLSAPLTGNLRFLVLHCLGFFHVVYFGTVYYFWKDHCWGFSVSTELSILC